MATNEVDKHDLVVQHAWQMTSELDELKNNAWSHHSPICNGGCMAESAPEFMCTGASNMNRSFHVTLLSCNYRWSSWKLHLFVYHFSFNSDPFVCLPVYGSLITYSLFPSLTFKSFLIIVYLSKNKKSKRKKIFGHFNAEYMTK